MAAEITLIMKAGGQVFVQYPADTGRPAVFVGHRAGNVLELAESQAVRTHYSRIKRFAEQHGLELAGKLGWS